MKRFFLLALSVSVAVLHQACGSSSPAATGTSCAQPSGCPAPDPPTTQLTTPAVTFSADVAPVFQGSCALSSSCHSLKVGGPSQLYLGTGTASGPEDTAGVLAAIVGVPSVELPSMAYVKAGDVANSFLMHKMDGDVCQLASQCGSTPAPSCGVVMPQSGCALDAAARDAVRRWIAQGAKND